MKLFITHDIFTSQAYGGISRYFVEILKRLPKQEVKVFLFAGLHINEYLRELGRVAGIKVPVLNNNKGTQPIAIYMKTVANIIMHRLRKRTNDVLQRMMVNAGRDTIVHLSYYTDSSSDNRLKTVVTVYDMIHELFPHRFSPDDPTTLWKRTCCERADRIIAISENTKKDLVDLLGIKPDKIAVVHLGSSLADSVSINHDNRVYSPYLLYVGDRGSYKNFDALARVFGRSDVLKNNFGLVCFGGGAFSFEEKKLFIELGVGDRIRHARGNDDLLATYYKNARAFICPSLYEGFGIPPLEALSLGCPVICSHAGSIPEVVGDAGIYFDPGNLDHMQQVLEASLFDDSLLSKKTVRGIERASMFSWDKTAAETLSVYHSILS